MPVHFPTTERTIRLTGRPRTKVPRHAHTNGAIHDHVLPLHQKHSATAVAQRAGTGIVTTTTTHARPNPAKALAHHDLTCRMFLPPAP
jgi:hypothetical protein